MAGKNYAKSSETHAFNFCKMNANPKLSKTLIGVLREKKFMESSEVLNSLADDH